MLASPSPFLPTLLDLAPIPLARSQAAPAPEAAAPAHAADKKADAPKDAEAPADAPKPKKKKVQHFSPVVPVLVTWVLLWLSAVHPQTPHFLVHRPLPRLTLPLPPLLRRRRLMRPQMLPTPRRRRLHTLALLVQSFLPCVRLLSAAFLHTCTPTLSFLPCLL